MSDLSIFKLDTQTINIKDTTARQTADSAKTLATTASGNATTALNKINELESEKADAIISSTSGAIASFPDGAESTAKKLVVGIEPVQEGTGDPSPDNVRPITGWTGAKVTVSPTTDEADGQTYDITFPSEAGTVYGGTLDVTNGVLTVDRICATFNGAFSGVFNSGYVNPAESDSSTDSAFCLRVNSNYEHVTGQPLDEINPTGFCSTFKNESFSAVNNRTVNGFSVQGNWAEAFIFYYPGLKKLSDWLNWFVSNPTQICYELATPITYHLTPQEITTLLGQNNIWADTGDVDVTYRADTKLYIDKKFTELQALILEN